MRVLSICHGAGLLDLAFVHAGFSVEPCCEIDPRMRAMYADLHGSRPAVFYDIHEFIKFLKDVPQQGIDLVIGGPPCQSHSKTRAMRAPKFPDLTPQVREVLDLVRPRAFLFENVVRLDIPGGRHVRLDAMHFHRPHQSRPRWFTYSPNLTPPLPVYSGNVDDLMAYSTVAGRIYGPKRGAVLQGYPDFSKLPHRCTDLQMGIANAVPYPLALAWAKSIMVSLS